MVHRLLQRHRVDTESDIVESELGHERDIRLIGIAAGECRRVVTGMLGEPLRGVDAVFQMLDADKGGPHIGSAILRGGGNSQGKQKESKTVSHFKPLQPEWKTAATITGRELL